jgi:PhnB protein
MSGNVKAIPDGYEGITPYICIRGAARAIDFYKTVFGAEETLRLADPSGKIGHAEISIGGRHVMLSDEFPDWGANSPEAIGGSPVTLHLYVDDVDAVVARAVGAGATILRPVEDQFYGDRGGKLRDPFGHVWWIATHIEDVSNDEVKARAAKLHGMS